MSRDEVSRELSRGVEAFERVYGKRPRSIAAPGWVVSDEHLLAQETFGFDYASDGRGDEPFVPVVAGTELETIQVPTTMPTTDELLGMGGTTRANVNEAIVAAASGDRDEVYVLHTEVEGRSLAVSFAALIEKFREQGLELCSLDRLAARARAGRATLPRRRLVPREIPGRSGVVGVAS
jgi:hypothetical protein